MARLLRVHFAAIGHRDARLAPLTLDLRGADGGGTDSLLWLRNGGGKSSILNLFYSLFRPSSREFLGSNAEGKARRIEHYIQGTDLACVLTEWSEGGSRDLFAPRTLLVGQVLSWKGQQISADTSRLRRLFFSMRTGPGVSWEGVPVQGLGGQAASHEAFRDWLEDLARQQPQQEVVRIEGNLRAWGEHLERLGLDPEIFRYQIKMNEREGAADEQFRFNSAREFVDFLLRMAFDPRHADQISASLESLREQLRRRPGLELEQRFLSGAQARLGPLAEAVQAKEAAEDALQQVRARIAGAASSLSLGAERREAESVAAAAIAEEAAREAREAANRRDLLRRWARGLERRAAELEVAEARAELARVEGLVAEADRSRRILAAAEVYREVADIVAREEALRAALHREQIAQEPLRLALAEAGAALSQALQQEADRLAAAVAACTAERQVVLGDAKAIDASILAASQAVARLRTQEEHAQRALEERDRARAALRARSLLDDREPAEDAAARWLEQVEGLTEERWALEQATEEEERTLTDLSSKAEGLAGEHAALSLRQKHLDAALEAALAWRDRLQGDALLQEVAESEAVALEAVGLADVLGERAEAHHRRLLELAVDDAEDRRAVAGVEETGLLPPPRDVERVVAALRAQRFPAFSARGWLEQNVPLPQREALLQADPARYDGVIVTDPAALGAALPLVDLRRPVQISAPTLSAASPAGDDGVRVLPGDPGGWDPLVARTRCDEIAQRRQTREEEVRAHRERHGRLLALTADLRAFLAQHGGGALEALREQVDTTHHLLASLSERRRHLEAERAQHQTRRGQLRSQLAALPPREAAAREAAQALAAYLERHEQRAQEHRDALERCRTEQRRLSEERLPSLRAQRQVAQQAADALAEERQRLVYRAEQVEAEQQAIAHRAAAATAAGPARTLPEARAQYGVLLRQWEGALSQSLLQGRLEELQAQLSERRRDAQRLSRDLPLADIEAAQQRGDPARQREQVEQAHQGLLEQRGQARAALGRAQSGLSALQGRRDAADLPPGIEPPPSADEARQDAEQRRQEAEACQEQEVLASQRRAEAHLAAQEAAAAARQQRELHASLRAAVGELPLAPPDPLPEAPEALSAAIRALQEASRAAEQAAREQAAEARRRAEEVQRFASDERFAEYRSQIRERLRDPAEALLPRAAEHREELERRAAVIVAALEGIRADERTLLLQIDEVARSALDVLEQAERASRMPERFAAWAGRPFLRVRAPVPTDRAERLARLSALVDGLVAAGAVPSGLALSQRAVEALVGSQGFDVTILKPDAHLRPDRIPIAGMATFSRGQQLTAAIMLYCTLVQLRARSRGQTRADAGILILDNPIGTCSSVPLLDLQLHIARTMRVQLVYTTGVHDHDAIATFPNTIRLRNAHRDRRSGDHHVTAEAESAVEGVRILAKNAP